MTRRGRQFQRHDQHERCFLIVWSLWIPGDNIISATPPPYTHPTPTPATTHRPPAELHHSTENRAIVQHVNNAVDACDSNTAHLCKRCVSLFSIRQEPVCSLVTSGDQRLRTWPSRLDTLKSLFSYTKKIGTPKTGAGKVSSFTTITLLYVPD